jgi:flagella basal body P-ring formation protein FlgA
MTTIPWLLMLAMFAGGEETRGGQPAKVPPKVPVATPKVGAPTAIEVRCLSQALVRGVDVRLRDVAEIHCTDPTLAQRLGDVSFGRRPARGFNRALPQMGIRAQLAAEGVAPDQLSLTGAAETIVQSLSTAVQPAELIDVAQPILRAALELEPTSDIEFELSGKLEMVEAPPGRRSFDLRGRLRGNKLAPTNAVVEVAVMVDDEEFKVVPVTYRLRRFATTVFVVEPLRRDAALAAEFLEERRTEITPGAETLHVSSLAAVAGKVAARDLRRGQTLRVTDLALPAVVRTGDPVSVAVRRGGSLVTLKCIARSSGAVGARVDVVTRTGRVLRGIVEGPGLVVIPTGVEGN